MFDMKKEKWFIRTPTPEISEAVQNWLFEQGLSWQAYGNKEVNYTDTNYLMLSPYEPERFCHTFSIDDKLGQKEIKLTFKTIVDSIECPEIKSEEQKQLDILMQQITDLQKQAEKLQGIVGK